MHQWSSRELFLCHIVSLDILY